MTHDSLQVEKTAAAWLARRDAGNWNSRDEAKLATWLDASTAHRVAYLRLEAAWERARHLKVNAANT
jgi:transmembrane sensor